MGSGRDKRKKAKPKAPGAGAEKTSRKTERNEGKAVKRAAQAAKVIPDIPHPLFFREGISCQFSIEIHPQWVEHEKKVEQEPAQPD